MHVFQTDDSEWFRDYLLDALKHETQPSVRFIAEWLLIRLVLHCPSLQMFLLNILAQVHYLGFSLLSYFNLYMTVSSSWWRLSCDESLGRWKLRGMIIRAVFVPYRLRHSTNVNTSGMVAVVLCILSVLLKCFCKLDMDHYRVSQSVTIWFSINCSLVNLSPKLT